MISCCIITRGEGSLRDALLSVREHVDETCVLENADYDNYTLSDREGLPLIDWGKRFEWCDDFSAARNASFALATQPVAMWIDSDDVLVGGEHLQAIVDSMPKDKPWMLECIYDYEHDEEGRCTAQQTRTFMVSPPSVFEWRYPVHEQLLPKEGAQPVVQRTHLVKIVHKRTPEQGKASNKRNLAILDKWVEREPANAYAVFLHATALLAEERYDEACTKFEWCADAPDANEIMRAHAAMSVADIHTRMGQLPTAIAWATRAVAEREWCECYFVLARAYMEEAKASDSQRDWQRAAHYARVALSTPQTQTAIWCNPLIREFHCHDILSTALGRIGDVQGALDEARIALRAMPGDGPMTQNAMIYEAMLLGDRRRALATQVKSLVERELITSELADAVTSAAELTPVRLTMPSAPQPDPPELPGRPTLHMLLAPDAAGGQVTDPRDHLAGTGAGGSRAGFMGLVRALGRLGKYDITAYSTFLRKREELDGIIYQRWDDLHGMEEADVVFAYYDVRMLGKVPYGPLRIGSHHTLHPYVAWPYIDVNTAPSEWALNFLRSVFRPMSRWELLPNAIEGLEGVEHKPVPGRVIYQTSPDRGLHQLLEMWPDIRKRVPHAELHVTGNPEGMVHSLLHRAWKGSDEQSVGQRLSDAMITAQQAGGVAFLGRVTRERMLQELSEASCFAFPCELWSPSETFSISILEAERIGVPVVLCPQDALESVWGESGCVLVRPPIRDSRPAFVDAVARVLLDKSFASRVSVSQREFSQRFQFSTAVEALDRIIRKYLRPVEKQEAAQ